MRRAVLLAAASVLVVALALVGRAATREEAGTSACGAIGERERARSPDGSRVAFVRCTRAGAAYLYVGPVGAQADRITFRSYGCCYRPSREVVFAEPAWSPDGQRLAVVIRDIGGTDVWVVRLADRAARRLTSGPARESRPRWSADGERVLFRRETGESGAVAAGSAER